MLQSENAPSSTGKPKNNSSNPARDECQTPYYAIEPLLPYLKQMVKPDEEFNIWESAVGEGLLASYFLALGYSMFIGSQLNGKDYFLDSSVPENYSIQITNPPYSKKYQWLKRAYELQKPFALLMPADSMFAGKKAVPLFEQYGVEILLPYQRINYKMPNKGWEGSAQFHSAWFTWGMNIGKFLTYVTLDRTNIIAPHHVRYWMSNGN
jgi:hypothetical protein